MKQNKLKYGILSCILCVLSFSLFGCGNNKENTAQNNTNPTRTGAVTNITTNTTAGDVQNRVENIMETPPTPQPVEKDASFFTTPLKSKAEGRLNNIHITCETLNGTVVQNGETFSFNQTIGKSTVEKGYEEADVIIDGKTEKALGGGNCQVSSTLYNAVLEVNGIEVTERHEHGKDVTYVPEGKDAAVSYGGLDLKFKNKTGSTIKIYASTDDIYVAVRIVTIQS